MYFAGLNFIYKNKKLDVWWMNNILIVALSNETIINESEILLKKPCYLFKTVTWIYFNTLNFGQEPFILCCL